MAETKHTCNKQMKSVTLVVLVLKQLYFVKKIKQTRENIKTCIIFFEIKINK